MKFLRSIPIILFVIILCAGASGATSFTGEDNAAVTARVTRHISSLPLAFTENRGQWDESVLFRADAGGAVVWFASDGTYYQFTRPVGGREDIIGPDNPDFDIREREPEQYEAMMIKASFEGANLNPRVIGDEMKEYKCNYFIGNDPAEWHTDVPNYKAVVYEEIYPGIDLKYYGNGLEMEYDFIVSPGVDYSQIRIQYEGVESVSVNGDGELVVTTVWGNVIERCPVIYQKDGASKIELTGRFIKYDDKVFGFDIAEDIDRTLALVIDPVLEYSTFIRYYLDPSAIAVDQSGCAYVIGSSPKDSLPVVNAFQPYNDDGTVLDIYDAYIAKFNQDGSDLVYATYLGGIDYDCGYDIAVDASGCAYVTGYTASDDFPVLGGLFTSLSEDGPHDAFVTKLNSVGNGLVYSTYLGGDGSDFGHGIAVGNDGAAYVTGWTYSSDFPTVNPIQTDQNFSDVFVTKINPGGTALSYSTYLGGNLNSDYSSDIAVNESGCAYITGTTYSSDFPTKGNIHSYWANGDVIISKLAPTGDSLIYSTFLGGEDYDNGSGIAIDAEGCAYITGYTDSDYFWTKNAFQDELGGHHDAFITKINADGSDEVYSTYFGGNLDDWGRGIDVDNTGCAYITGETYSASTFPTEDPIQPHANDDYKDIFISKMNAVGDGLKYSTHLGGNYSESAEGIAVDIEGNAYVTGLASSDFPTTPGSYDPENSIGGTYVLKIYQPYEPGDANGDETVNIADASFIVNAIFFGGAQPPSEDAADANCDGTMNIADASYLVNYIFFGGDPPC